MTALIGALRVSLSADTAAFSQGMSRAERQAKASGSAIQRSLGGIKAAATGLAAGLTAGMFVSAARQAFDYASSLAELAAQAGTTVEQYQILQRMALENGLSGDKMDAALKKLNITLGEARNGSKTAALAFSQLGIDFTRTANAGEAFPQVAEAISRMTDSSTQAAAAKRLMGRAAADLLPILQQGAQGYNTVAEKARAAGLVTAEMARRADEAADKLGILGFTAKTQLAIGVAEAIPFVEALGGGLVELANKAATAYAWLERLASFKVGEKSGPSVGQRAWQQISQTNPAIGIAVTGLMAMGAKGKAKQDPAVSDFMGGLSRFRNTAPIGDIDVDFSGGSGGGKKKRGGKSAEQMERERQRLAEEALHNAQRFEEEVNRAQQNIAMAKAELADGLVERNKFERDQLDLAYEQRVRDLKNDEALTEARRAELLAYEEKLYALEADRINKAENVALEQDMANLIQSRLTLEQDLVRAQSDMATTAAERRKLELRLLDLQYQEEAARLKAISLRNGATQGEVDAAQERLGRLGELRGYDEARVKRGTMGPLESYFDSLPKTAAEVNEAMEAVAAGGIQSVIDGLADAATGARSLADVFKNVAKQIIADLIRIQLQRALVKGLSGALGNLFGNPLSGLSSPGFGFASQGAITGGTDFSGLTGIPGFARGGSGIINGRSGYDTNLLSLNGIPLAKVSHGERLTVSPDGGGGRQTVINMNGVMTTDQFWSTISQMDNVSVVRGSTGAQQSMHRRSRRQIPTGR